MGMPDQKALVTGGSRGIGRAIAMGLSAKGYDVTIMGRSPDTLAKAVKEGVARRSHAVDVTDEAALSAAVAKSGPYHIVINNAGAAESAPFAATRLDLAGFCFHLAGRIYRAAITPFFWRRRWGASSF